MPLLTPACPLLSSVLLASIKHRSPHIFQPLLGLQPTMVRKSRRRNKGKAIPSKDGSGVTETSNNNTPGGAETATPISQKISVEDLDSPNVQRGLSENFNVPARNAGETEAIRAESRGKASAMDMDDGQLERNMGGGSAGTIQRAECSSKSVEKPKFEGLQPSLLDSKRNERAEGFDTRMDRASIDGSKLHARENPGEARGSAGTIQSAECSSKSVEKPKFEALQHSSLDSKRKERVEGFSTGMSRGARDGSKLHIRENPGEVRSMSTKPTGRGSNSRGWENEEGEGSWHGAQGRGGGSNTGGRGGGRNQWGKNPTDALGGLPTGRGSNWKGWENEEREESWHGARGRGRGSNTGGRGGGRNQWGKNPIDALGRAMSGILRHRAVELRLNIRSDGYVAVEDLLKLGLKTSAGVPLYSHTVLDIKEAVMNDNKQRFGLLEENGRLFIRANQGHSIESVESEKLLKPILSAEEVPVCVHGTYLKNKESILKEGLKRMQRLHVHFARGLRKDDGVISGMRGNCDVLIYLDVQKALEGGMKLYLSENGVVLTEGFNGVVPPAYFANIETLAKKETDKLKRAVKT